MKKQASSTIFHAILARRSLSFKNDGEILAPIVFFSLVHDLRWSVGWRIFVIHWMVWTVSSCTERMWLLNSEMPVVLLWYYMLQLQQEILNFSFLVIKWYQKFSKRNYENCVSCRRSLELIKFWVERKHKMELRSQLTQFDRREGTHVADVFLCVLCTCVLVLVLVLVFWKIDRRTKNSRRSLGWRRAIFPFKSWGKERPSQVCLPSNITKIFLHTLKDMVLEWMEIEKGTQRRRGVRG